MKPIKVRFSPWVISGWMCATGVLTAPGAANEAKTPRPAPLERAAVFVGPDGKVPPGSVGQVHVMPDTATFWKTLGALKESVKHAKTLTVFQGRPRAVPKSGARVDAEPTEVEKKGLFMVDGEWFCAAPAPQLRAAEVSEALRAAVFAGVKERKGTKLCGGFHADVLLRWGGGILAETDVLLCFGCSEVKIYGATGALYGDLADAEAKRLRELLAPLFEKRNAAGEPKSGAEDWPTPPARL